MSRTGTPFRRWWPLVAASSLVLSCASVVGLDDLAYDLGDGSGGAGPAGPSSTSTGEPATTSSASTSTTDASSSSAASSASSGSGDGGSGGEGGTGGEGGSPPTGFVVTGDLIDYRELLRDYGASIWHLDEADGASIAADDGDADYDYQARYKAEQGTLTYAVAGIFPNDAAVAFAGGARAEVPLDDAYYDFHLAYDNGPFAFMFFAKLDAAPAEPLVVASCLGEDAYGDENGWSVLLSDEVVLELHGRDVSDTTISEPMASFTFPTDGAWHFVIVTRREDRSIRGYLDGEPVMDDSSAIVQFPFTDGLFTMGAEAGAAPSTEAVTLDEVAFVAAALHGDQIDSLIACLQGDGCFAD